MPLHISEIGVHVAVGNPEADPDPDAPAGHPASPPMTQSRLRQLVSACVRQVLKALRMRQQR